jgi:hypothetical protein
LTSVVDWARAILALGLDQGMSIRPMNTHSQSSTSAIAIVATMPVMISIWIPR